MKNIKDLRITFCGSHGTGKTTLLQLLISKYTQCNFITEVARTIIEETGVKPQDMTIEQKIQFQEKVLTEQLLEERKSKGFISDRCILDNLAYMLAIPNKEMKIREFGKKMKYEEFVKFSVHKRYDIIFYTPIEFELEKDGTRFEDSEFQKEIDHLILQKLDEYRIPYITLRGSVEERIAIIENAIDLFSRN